MNKRPYGYIYLTTNLVNNKKYIGLKKGKYNPKYLGSGIGILKAIKKYGKENFQNEIIEICYTQKSLYEAEIRHINDKNCVASRIYYNMASGGANFVGKGTNNPMYGKFHSQESKDKISKSNSGKNNGNYGKKFSKSTKEKMSMSAKKGHDHPKFKRYYHTPFGKLSASRDILKFTDLISATTLIDYCKNSEKIITKQSYYCSKYLKTLPKSVIGKTYKQIGFYSEE